MKTQNILFIIVSLIAIVAIGYIATEKINFCEQAKNESYQLGFNQGIEQWNSAVILNVNNNGAIPYWFNNTYMELPISQLCGVQNG